MATKLTGSGSIPQYRDPNPKFLGIKCSHGTHVMGGFIIVRQKGNKYYAEPKGNVTTGRDFTISSNIEGHVVFRKATVRGYDGSRKCVRTYVSVQPLNK